VNFADLMYASCPKCGRMDLNKWTGHTYVAPFWVEFRTKMGANRWRCEYCRINFASFRPRKEVFTFKRWRILNSGPAVAEGRARWAELEAKADEQRTAEEALARAASKAARVEARTTEETEM
jgi:hypothetical protein